jgi:D-3-phosphoglycerate dehydrogenase
VTRTLLKGFLEAVGGQEVNQVNVKTLASSIGLVVEEVKSNEQTDYNEWLHAAVFSNGQRISAAGTILGRRQQPRIVRLFSQAVEIVPEGVLFIMNNKDRPGMVGYIGNLMGKYKINIGHMSLNRDCAGGQALTILNLDTAPAAEVLEELKRDPDISNVKVVKL